METNPGFARKSFPNFITRLDLISIPAGLRQLSLSKNRFPTSQFFVFVPQTPGGAHPRSLASA